MANRQQPSPQQGEKREKSRADRFWEAFLFTENGKPKSSLIIYTFSLSIVFAAVYVVCYEAAIRLLTGPLSSLPAWQSNLLIALISSAAGVLLCCFPHRFFREKRLVFGGHLWLCIYAAAVLLIMLALMGFTESFTAFLVFFGWTAAFPVASGTAVSGALYRRDHRRQKKAEPEPEWKKYVNHSS